MNLSLFRTFIRVVETKNLSRTAEELGLSQPAVSKQIQSLEEIYGVLLLERSGRRIKTTEAGEALCECAHEVIRVLDRTAQVMEDMAGSKRGNLLLGASTIPGQYILPRYLKEFKEAFPHIGITMDVADTEKIYSRVSDREIDVGVVGALISSRKVDSFKWVTDELVVLIPPGHHLSGAKKVELKNLTREPWIFREKGSGTRMAAEQMLGEVGVSPESLKIQAEMGSTEAVVAAVEAGLGVALVSRLVAENRISRAEVLEIAEGIGKRDIYVIYPRQKNRRKTAESFLEFLRG